MVNTFTGHMPKAARIAASLRDKFAGWAERMPKAEPGTGPDWLRFVPADYRGLVASHLPAGLPDFRAPDFHGTPGFPPPGAPDGFTPAPVPAGAEFLACSFSNPAGTRPYKLYVPSGYHGEPVPLIVMLHGCTQSPDDFAAGTGMNRAAEEQTFLVAYPGQPKSAHPQKCWKWFSADDQQRGQGEPSLIAGITRQVMADYAVDPKRVYVAGMSAGGAAASIMGETYPDLYAAIGVHSGLACGSARDLQSALVTMKRGSGAAPSGRPGPGARRRMVPAIVFHGERDTTVSPLNGDDVVAQAVTGAAFRPEVENGQSPGGHTYRRTIYRDGSGKAMTEQWLIHGAGHAWVGGNSAGSYTDPNGPDATREMLRFFREHPHPAPSSTAQ